MTFPSFLRLGPRTRQTQRRQASGKTPSGVRPRLEVLEDRTVPSAPAASAWPMYGQNAQHTGVSAVTGSQAGHLDWYSVAAWNNPLAIGTDGLYTSNAALNFDGSLRWSYPLGATNITPALAADGTLYTGSQSGILYAFNPTLPGAYVDETHQLVGGLKWSLQIGQSQSSPVIAPDGTVYVSSLDSYLYAVNPNGTLKWRFKTGQAMESSPALAPNGTIYAGSDDNNLYAINPNGSLKWKFKATDDVNASPAVGPDGTIYITSTNSRAWAVDANGQQKWRVTIGPGGPWSMLFGGPAVNAASGTVYFGGGDGLYAFGFNGTLRWKAASASVWSHPAIGTDGAVYFHANDGVLRAVRPNGSALWSASVGGSIKEPVLGADGTVYVSGMQGGVHAFRDGGVGRPTIGWLHDSPDPVGQGGTLTLWAVDSVDGNGTIQQLDFYRDVDGDGILNQAVDLLLGSNTNGQPQWSLTVDVPPGTYTYFAVATDNEGHTSNVVSTTNTVAAPLLAQGLPAGRGTAAQTLTAAELHPLLNEAIARWEATGLTAEQLAALHSADIRIADLGGTTLGLAAGSTIWLDDDAAGWGWFLDPTPGNDSEFLLPGDQGEQGGMDLLTALMHEIGHVLGYDHGDGVMHETLAAGTRDGLAPMPVPVPVAADTLFASRGHFDAAWLTQLLERKDRRA